MKEKVKRSLSVEYVVRWDHVAPHRIQSTVKGLEPYSRMFFSDISNFNDSDSIDAAIDHCTKEFTKRLKEHLGVDK